MTVSPGQVPRGVDSRQAQSQERCLPDKYGADAGRCLSRFLVVAYSECQRSEMREVSRLPFPHQSDTKWTTPRAVL